MGKHKAGMVRVMGGFNLEFREMMEKSTPLEIIKDLKEGLIKSS